MPETRYASMVQSVAATLCLQFMAHVKLFPMINDLYFCILKYVCIEQTGLFSVLH